MSDHDEILVALRRITRAIDLQSKRLVKAIGLTAPQLVVIDTLRKRGDLSPSAIARAVSLSQATITSILDRLTQAGLVERVKSDRGKRVVMARLTDTGRAAGENAPELLQAGFLRSFRKLQPWEQNMLIASLQRIAELMDAEGLDAAPFLDTGEITQ